MAKPGLKGIAVALIVFIVGVYLTNRYTQTYQIILLGALSVVAIMALVSRTVHSAQMEIFITGSLLAIPETYVFFIQPHIESLPAFPPNAELFFGIAILTRILLLALEHIDNPLRSQVKKLVGR